MDIQELRKNIIMSAKSYFMIDYHNDREKFYSIPEEVLLNPENNPLVTGKLINLWMDGKLEEADALLAKCPQDDIMTLGLIIVNPTVTWKQFIDTLKRLKEMGRTIRSIILTAGRPFLLNGFNDFSRIGPFLEKNRDTFIDLLSHIYGNEHPSYIYQLCLAEYYYQQNRLNDAIDLVTSCINAFYRKNEHRLLFSALYLQSKILLANGTTEKVHGFIDEIKNRIKDEGKQEYEYNLNAAEAYFSLYEGNHTLIQHWLTHDAPDEYADFNMLDLYRYMVKLRCYLISDSHTALVALVEKLRPLLEAGRRFQDLCETDLLLAMALHSINRKKEAYEALERALKIVRRRKYYRLVCDEGIRMLSLLVDYINDNGSSDFLMMLTDGTRHMGVRYPYYLDIKYTNKEKFSQREIEILHLLEQGMNKDEIAGYFFVTEDTVKYHLKKIYAKLDADSAVKALWNARQAGILR